MLWLGLLLAICFVPGYTGASIPTQWAVLSILLPLSLWRKGPITSLHKLFLLFMFWSAVSILWSINLYSWVWGMWLVTIWALSFYLGSTLRSLVDLWKGLAIGLGVSSAVAVAQALEFAPVEANDPYLYSGLLFNSSVQGISIALVLIALTIHRLWWYMPPLAIGLILAGSRGAFFILAIALIARYTHWLVAILAVVFAGLALGFWTDVSDSQRLRIWGITLGALSPFGQGSGSFIDVFYIYKDRGVDKLIRSEFVHNDYLQFIYEYGIGAIAIFIIYALALLKTTSREWPIFFGFAILSFFYFPAYAPLSAFIGFVVAGHISRDWVVDGNLLHNRRSDILSRNQNLEPRFDPTWGEALPLVARA